MKLLNSLRWLGGVLLFFGLILLFFSKTTLAESTPTVLTFEVQGNNHIPVEKVLGAISNSKIGQPLNSENVQLDMQAIMGLGYFADIRAKTEELLGGVKLIFVVVENPVFKELHISGLTKMKSEELQSFFKQKPGEIFNTALFRDDLGKAIKFCKDEKGLLVQYKETPQIISPDGIVKLELFELRYGRIVIQGLTRTKDYVVRRELLFKEGDIIDTNILQKSIMKVMQLRLFENPDPRFELTTDPTKVDLILNVKEAVGIGEISPQISWAPSTGQLTGSLIYSTPNLMGLGESLSLNINYSPSSTSITNTTSRGTQFSFREPWLDSKHTSFQLTMGSTDSTMRSSIISWYPDRPDLIYTNPSTQELHAYDLNLNQTNLSLTFGRPVWGDVTASLGFNFERNDIQNPTELPASLDPADGGPTHGADATPPTRPLLFWDNSAQFGLVKNELMYQDAWFVNGGYQLSGQYKLSSNLLGSNYNYQKISLDGKKFFQVVPNLIWGVHFTADWLYGDYPDYDALYMGGMYKLRGYSSDRFSDDPGARDLIGTRGYLFNTELRYRTPANKNIEALLFFDVGQIYNNIKNQDFLKSDYGIGFRYIIPFLGELGLDLYMNSDGTYKTVFIVGETF